MSGDAATAVSRRQLLLAAAASLAAMAAVYLLSPREFVTGDTVRYLRMVEGLPAPEPWGYRVLTPAVVAALVRVFAVSPDVGFFAVAYAATFGTLVATFLLLRRLDVSPAAATVAAALCCFAYPVAEYLGRWGRVDPLANLFFAVGLLLIVERRFLPACAVITIGLLAKETSLLLVPLLVVERLRHSESRDGRAWIAAALLGVVPVLGLLAIRAAVPVEEGIHTVRGLADLPRIWQRTWSYNVGQHGFLARAVRDLSKSYGFLWTMAACGLLLEPRRRLTCLYLIAGGFLLCTLAVDWARMLGTGFPGVFIPAAFVVERIFAGAASSRRTWTVLAPLLGLAAVQCYLSFLVLKDLSAAGRVGVTAGFPLVVLLGSAVVVWSQRAALLASYRSLASRYQTPSRHKNA